MAILHASATMNSYCRSDKRIDQRAGEKQEEEEEEEGEESEEEESEEEVEEEEMEREKGGSQEGSESRLLCSRERSGLKRVSLSKKSKMPVFSITYTESKKV